MQKAYAEGLEQYNPGRLLNVLAMHLKVKTDAALSEKLELTPQQTCKIRSGAMPISAPILIQMHEVSNISIKELRELMGDRREHFRAGKRNFQVSQ